MRQTTVKKWTWTLSVWVTLKASTIKLAKTLGTWMDNNLNLKITVNNMCKTAYYHLKNV